jgi:predicted phage tail protein
LITVYLYGYLGKKYGKKHLLDIHTPAEAIRAMGANHKDFNQTLIDGGQIGYRIITGVDDRANHIGLHLPFGKNNDLKIIPTVYGGGGFGKILLGAALIVASFYLPGAGAAAGGITASSVAAAVGFSLVLGGVSSLLFSPDTPSLDGYEAPDNKPSYSFNGAVNTTRQGNPVPLGYGRLRVGSQVISASTETNNL